MIAHTLSAIPEGARQQYSSIWARTARRGCASTGATGAHRRQLDRRPATYSLRDPSNEPWYREAARLDNGFDAIVGAERPPLYVPPAIDRLELLARGGRPRCAPPGRW